MGRREDELRKSVLAILSSANSEVQSRNNEVHLHPRLAVEAQKAVELQKTDLEFAKRQMLVGRFVGTVLILVFGVITLFVRDQGVEFVGLGLMASLGIISCLTCISLFTSPIEKRYGRGRFSIIQNSDGKRRLVFEIRGKSD